MGSGVWASSGLEPPLAPARIDCSIAALVGKFTLLFVALALRRALSTRPIRFFNSLQRGACRKGAKRWTSRANPRHVTRPERERRRGLLESLLIIGGLVLPEAVRGVTLVGLGGLRLGRDIRGRWVAEAWDGTQ